MGLLWLQLQQARAIFQNEPAFGRIWRMKVTGSTSKQLKNFVTLSIRTNPTRPQGSNSTIFSSLDGKLDIVVVRYGVNIRI